MAKRLSVVVAATVLGLGSAPALHADGRPMQTPGPALAPSYAPAPEVESLNALVGRSCATCHSERTRAGGLSLVGFDVADVVDHAEVAERMIRKLRAGMMPPANAPNRPPAAQLEQLAAALEAPLDAAAKARPNPGHRSFQRLNRAEYRRVVRDLLDLDVDVTALLPPDTFSHGFDNIAAEQAFSPTLIQSYLGAATKIARLAMGSPEASPGETTYRIPRTASQMVHVEGTPFGTRGGISVVHTFPADGDYTIRMLLHAVPTGELFGSAVRDEAIDVSINGTRVALVPIDYSLTEASEHGLNLTTPPIHLEAGPQRVSAAFVQHFEGPVDDLMAPIDHTLADTIYGTDVGITALPHMRDLAVTGPFDVTGVSATPSRRRILTCQPETAADESQCAYRILRRLAARAYREPESRVDAEPLMAFYEQGRKSGDFENGIRAGLQALLASPRFVFRFEERPDGVRPGENYPINDLDLASRLSFFIWATAPDEELLALASDGRLSAPAVLEAEVRRLLADPRSEALSTRFAAQWLRLQDIDQIAPDAVHFPSFNQQLADGFQRETELLFDSIVREDRSVLRLLDADYTFVNERLARHYGIPNVTGSEFRRVPLTGALDARRGLLGQGSVLLMTSVPDRTSPVLRGKWIMEVLLGTPPPPPPPNVPALDDSAAAVAEGGAPLSVRQRMEQHRRNPACASCHRVIDPLGLALEHFDVTGKWRIKDNGVPVDARGALYDGSAIDGAAGLREALLGLREPILRNFTENLLQYALGRRVEYYDQPTVRAIVRAAEAKGDRLSAFVLGVVNSPAFRLSRAETTVVEHP